MIIDEFDTTIRGDHKITSFRATIKRSDVRIIPMVKAAHTWTRARAVALSTTVAAVLATSGFATTAQAAHSVTMMIPPAKPVDRNREAKIRIRLPPAIRAVLREADIRAAEKVRAERIHVIRQTVFGEARSEGKPGMRVVAHVIMNRWAAQEIRYGRGVRGVALKRKQFSCWNRGDPNRKAILNVEKLDHDSLDYQRWIEAGEIAQKVYDGELRDNISGATFYHTTGMVAYWRKDMKVVGIAGKHIFFKPKRRGSTFE